MSARRQLRILILALALAALPVAPALAGRPSGARHALSTSRGPTVEAQFGTLSPAQRARLSRYVPHRVFPSRGYASRSTARNERLNEQRLLRSDWHYIARHLPPHLFPAGGFASATAATGFNWRDAGIGATAAVVLMLLASAGVAARKRRGWNRNMPASRSANYPK
jgi:hypothetical protein